MTLRDRNKSAKLLALEQGTSDLGVSVLGFRLGGRGQRWTGLSMAESRS